MSSEFAMVRCSGSVASASLGRIQLADEGIESFIFDDQITDIYCGLTCSPYGARLLVKSADEQQARAILNRVASFETNDDEAVQMAVDEEDTECDPPQLLARLRGANKTVIGIIIWVLTMFLI